MSETSTNLKYGFATILVLVGLKMSLIDLVQIPVGISLRVISFLLVISMIASVVVKKSGT
jgi:tellurite resistance protein TerC